MPQREIEIVPLVLKPKGEGSEDDYRVLHGELEIEKIYRRKAALILDPRRSGCGLSMAFRKVRVVWR